MATSWANQTKAIEVPVGKLDALGARRLRQAEAMRVRHAAITPPPVHGGTRRAHGQGDTFDDLLHTPILATVAIKSQAANLAGVSVLSIEAGRYHGDMAKDPANIPAVSEMQIAFGKRVRLAREAAELTQDELGAKIGMDGKSVSNWERGLQFSYAPDLYRLARALDVTMDWLMDGNDRMLTVEMRDRLFSPRAEKPRRGRKPKSE